MSSRPGMAYHYSGCTPDCIENTCCVIPTTCIPRPLTQQFFLLPVLTFRNLLHQVQQLTSEWPHYLRASISFWENMPPNGSIPSPYVFNVASARPVTISTKRTCKFGCKHVWQIGYREVNLGLPYPALIMPINPHGMASHLSDVQDMYLYRYHFD